MSMCYMCYGYYNYPYYNPYQYYSPYQYSSPYQYYPYNYYGLSYGLPLGYVYGSPALATPAYPRGEHRVGNCLMICQ